MQPITNTRILWIPKSWKEFKDDPKLAYRTSNRLRAVNHHEFLQQHYQVNSDVLGITVQKPSFKHFDILVFQKNLFKTRKITAFRYHANRIAVLDICDPIDQEKTLSLNGMLDLVICSNHELESVLQQQGLRVPTATIIDSHEADPSFSKKHTNAHLPLVTWYGVGANYEKFIAPLKRVLHNEKWIFRWAAENDPKWTRFPDFESGIKWQLSINDAWQQKNSWQHFIQRSDIGIVPVFESVKSPHKILNYMAYGIPVICSPTDAHKRIITHGENGFFASTQDEWEHYLTILSQAEARQNIGEKARETVQKHYSPQISAKQYLNTLLDRFNQKQTATKSRFFGMLKRSSQTKNIK